MVARIADGDFEGRAGLDDWRVVLGAAHGRFRASTFAGALDFVRAVGEAAEAADHHPDVDLRYPGIVHVVLTTHAAGGLSERDVSLATTISALAAGAGLTVEPSVPVAVEVAIDAIDIDAVRPFWKAVLGYVDAPSIPAGATVDVIVDPARIGPPFWFQQMDEPRPQRNRIHLDVSVPSDVAEARVEAAIAAGGRLVTDQYARSFWVLADAEGNEACICTWQDR